MKLSDFDYPLPPELIAQAPPPKRDQSRLFVLHRDGRREHRRFSDLPEYLQGETVYLNDSRVLRARIFLIRNTGGRVAALLVRRLEERKWQALLDASGRLKQGERLWIADPARPEFGAQAGGMGGGGVSRRPSTDDHELERHVPRLMAVVGRSGQGCARSSIWSR